MRAIWTALFIWSMTSIGAVADPEEMQSVIDRQLDAFQKDDFAAAMEFASPGIQRYFGTPEIFGRMVTQGYPMVWRPGAVQYLENRIEDGAHYQRVMITDQQGTTHVLEYRMLETSDGWRIGGVVILDSGDFSA